MTDQQRGCISVLLLAMALDYWIVIAFFVIRTWIGGLISLALMVFFHLFCKKAYGKSYYLMTYLVGVVTMFSTLLGLNVAWGIAAVSTIIMNCAYPLLCYMYDLSSPHREEYSDAGDDDDE